MIINNNLQLIENNWTVNKLTELEIMKITSIFLILLYVVNHFWQWFTQDSLL
jgi:hypothetical protein